MQQQLQYVCDGYPLFLITDGSSSEPVHLSQKLSHMAKNRKEFIKILKQFISEIQNGSIVPANSPPKYIINVFCVPKKDPNTNQMTKLRVVRHGSFNTSNTTSINDWIDPERCKMPTLPNLKDYINLLIDSNYFALRDLSDAFRQIGLASKDVGVIGYSLFGFYFFDRKQPYGISSAASNCQSFGQTVISILNNKIFPSHLSDNTLLHIDDFLFAAKTAEDVTFMHREFDKLCDKLNIKVSHAKDVDATQIATVYGFHFDLGRKTIGIPEHKLIRLKLFINDVIKYKCITGRALENLCGKIMHWSQLSTPAKSLCYNMLGFIHRHIRKNKKCRLQWFILPEFIIDDLKFWLKYSDLIKESPMSWIVRQPSIQLVGSSDACHFGAGFCIGFDWAFYRFSKKHKRELHINQKEAHAVITLLYNLKEQLSGKKLVLLVDNTTLFYAMIRHWSSPQMMPFVYCISLLMIKYRIAVWFEWIPTDLNKLADSLSRFDFKTFRKWVQIHNISVKPKPLTLTYIHDVCNLV